MTDTEDTKTVAALYVQTNGCYFNVPGVDPWDEVRDARMYGGPWPVVTHSPCQRWGRFWKGQPGNINKGKVERKGDDGGCFKCALSDVRRWGGVAEHPEGSHAWAHFGLTKPPRSGGWVPADDLGGWTCRVEQGQYGHIHPKPTWLYVFGLSEEDLPDLRWGVHPVTDDMFPAKAVAKHGMAYCRRAGLMAFMGGGKDSKARIATPIAFRDLLIQIARSTDTRK